MARARWTPMLAVAAALVTAPVAHAQSDAPSEPHWRKIALGVALSAAAYRSKLAELDRELEAQGYSSLSTIARAYGVEIEGVYRRLVLDARVDGLGERNATGVGEPIRATLLHFSFDAGYHVWHTRYTALYPSTGPVLSMLLLKFDPRTPPFSREELSSTGAKSADRSTVGLDLGITLEQILPFVFMSDDRTAALAPLLSFRVGYVWQLIDADYSLRLERGGTDHFRGGPHDDLGGVYVRLNLGGIIGLNSAADAARHRGQ